MNPRLPCSSSVSLFAAFLWSTLDRLDQRPAGFRPMPRRLRGETRLPLAFSAIVEGRLVTLHARETARSRSMRTERPLRRQIRSS